MRAIFSDIHANLHALQAVLADFRQAGVESYTCLGDVVGYGGNPIECLREVKRLPNIISILGNHDNAAIFDPAGFNSTAETAIFWTRAQIERAPDCCELMDFIFEMPRLVDCGVHLYMHGSPSNPTDEYVFPDDVYNHRKMTRLFERLERFGFCGHTHVPGIFCQRGTDFEFIHQYEIGTSAISLNRYDKALINVGSVGQPRDDNDNARYVVLDEQTNTIRYREVPYDIDGAQHAILSAEGLPDHSAERLRSAH